MPAEVILLSTCCIRRGRFKYDLLHSSEWLNCDLLFLFFCISIHELPYSSTHPSIYLSYHTFISLFIGLSIYLSIYVCIFNYHLFRPLKHKTVWHIASALGPFMCSYFYQKYFPDPGLVIGRGYFDSYEIFPIVPVTALLLSVGVNFACNIIGIMPLK